jgi:uroporphyrinogen-III synthase
LCAQLRVLGAEPIRFPVIAIAPPEIGGPLDQALTHLELYHWIIFTSVNGVQQFWNRLAVIGSAGPDAPFAGKVAAIGPVTAAALRQRGMTVDLMPDEYVAEAVLHEIDDVAGMRILLPRADRARPALAKGLRALGAKVDEVVAYRTVLAKPDPAAYAALEVGVDVVTFTSSSTVRNFLALTEGLEYGEPLITCIGPVTAATAGESGLRVDVVAAEYTIDGLLKALQRRFVEGHGAKE